jgi:large subunit ribosomal protein L24
MALTGRVQLEGVDGAALKHRGLAMPAGRVSARTSVSGQGRSAASLIGSLNGNGSVMIEQARIAGLDPRAFDAATRASDAGIARDDAKLSAAVGPALAAGALSVPTAEIPFAIRDGQVRVSNTTLAGEGARLNLSGGYDIAADQIDVRAALAATATDTVSIGRPEILVLLFGSPDKPNRSIDVAALSSWLGLRAIDRETRRLDAIERTNPLLNPQRQPEPQAAPPAPPPPPVSPRVEAPPVSAPAVAPPLPPPVEVRPPPGARPPPRQGAPLNILPNQQRPASSTF